MRLALRRIGASLIDWASILAWAAVIAAVGIPLSVAGFLTRRTNVVELNIIGALLLVIPIVLGMAALESRAAAATLGKRVLGLTVRTAGGEPAFLTSLLRNALKIGVPWLIGHAAAFALSTGNDRSGGVTTGVWILTAAAYGLPILYVASLFVGDGRTPYDRIAGTRVTSRPPVRMPDTDSS